MGSSPFIVSDGGGAGDVAGIASAIPVIGPLIGGLIGLFTGSSNDGQKIADRINHDESIANAGATYADGFNETLWTQGLRKWIPGLIASIGGTIAWAVRTIGPILNAINKLKKRLDDLFNRYIGPFLILLQRIRKLLLILRIFHVKFAAALDTRIADIERKITAPYLLIRAKLNEVVGWINLVADPFGGIKSIAIWPAITGIADAVRGIVTGTAFDPSYVTPPAVPNHNALDSVRSMNSRILSGQLTADDISTRTDLLTILGK